MLFYSTFKEVKEYLEENGPYATIKTTKETFEGVDMNTLFKENDNEINFYYHPRVGMEQVYNEYLVISSIISIIPSSGEMLKWIFKLLKKKKAELDKESSRINTLIGKVMSKKAEVILDDKSGKLQEIVDKE